MATTIISEDFTLLKMIKRIFDFIVSFIGILFFLPLFALIAIWIKFDSKGPVFFKQWRIGQFGKKFQIYKFRTMIENAESNGPNITVDDDTRISRSGKFLRRHKFDELAQLINVIKGEMSLVGPRPEVPKYVDLYQQDYRDILTIRPGITDLASLKYRNEGGMLVNSDDAEKFYIVEILPEKIRLAKEYIKCSTFSLDLKLIFASVFRMF
jgi:lipopolysaccharide/colanic/teichoic acid biosynthesis glycosyltransferase